MTVILVLLTFIFFLLLDALIPKRESKVYTLRGTQYTTPDFEMLGALAQDGGEPAEKEEKQ